MARGLTRLGLCAWLAGAALAGCDAGPNGLARVYSHGELRVGTVNEPTSYYLGAHGPQGFEYRLARAFADSLGVQLVIVPAHDRSALRDMLADGRVDIVAAELTADDNWKRVGLATTSYRDIPQLVVQRRGLAPIRNIAGLSGTRVVAREGSPQLELLRGLRGSGAAYLTWTELPREQADPLDWVNSGDADYAIIDRSEFAFARHLYPEASVAFTLPDPRPVQWLVRRAALDLRDAANRFFGNARDSGLLAQLTREAEAEAAAGDFEYQEARRFQDDIARRLPELREHFAQAASAQAVDWRLLAAVGYQESRWDDHAASADGAAGIMMLTLSTAKAMGVADRTNSAQNIAGGAAYLAQMLQMIPARIAEPDRTWLALAAYNVGFGHLEDARILAQGQGKNPDSWADVSQVLPWLAQERWYSLAKRGYARGWEPVRFVEQVRAYLAVLEWYGDGRPAGAAPAEDPTPPFAPALAPAPTRSAPAWSEKIR
ncbi:MAG TPA: membrane-bound lytic murein transglycosylase MltF [Steroidobacteraceae bacterium]|nr:membrane-bound lytic murein transglycosylase MltF [Steroidobacteraceae bacterium]